MVNNKRAQAIAAEIADEIGRKLGPIPPETLAVQSELICEIFGAALDRNKIVDEASAARVMAFVPQFLADKYRQRAELNARIDAAVRGPPGNF
jgi:hypothetical protein